MRKANYYNQAISILQELHKDHPTYNMGRHISTALDGYGDVWGMTDKELAFALEKYKAELGINIVPEEDIDKIVNDGLNLDSLFKEEDNGDY